MITQQKSNSIWEQKERGKSEEKLKELTEETGTKAMFKSSN